MVKIVSFDLDGTLIKKSFADYFWLELIPKHYSKKYGLTIDEAKRIVIREYEAVGMDDIRWYIPEYWINLFRLNFNVEKELNSIKHLAEPYPDAIEILESLYGRYDLVIATNAHRKFIEVEIRVIGEKYFKHVFSCVSNYNLPRKTEEFYINIARELNVELNDIVHVGDDEKYDFIIPRRIGVKAYYLNRNCKESSQYIIKSLLELKNILIDNL
ncbi:MAG: HAD family hydrolase [Candidatus Methanomethylicia archaeon]